MVSLRLVWAICFYLSGNGLFWGFPNIEKETDNFQKNGVFLGPFWSCTPRPCLKPPKKGVILAVLVYRGVQGDVKVKKGLKWAWGARFSPFLRGRIKIMRRSRVQGDVKVKKGLKWAWGARFSPFLRGRIKIMRGTRVQGDVKVKKGLKWALLPILDLFWAPLFA